MRIISIRIFNKLQCTYKIMDDYNNNSNSDKKLDENSTNLQAYYSCDKCDLKFNSNQELKDHSSSSH